MRETYFEDYIEEMRYSGFIYGLKVAEHHFNGPIQSNKMLSGDYMDGDGSSNGPSNGSNGGGKCVRLDSVLYLIHLK